MNILLWQKDYKAGLYKAADLKTQIDAGWYDWFCKDSSLANKTKRLAGIVTGLKKGGKVDLESNYVWFKNCCPLSGPLYDRVMFADVESNENLFCICVGDEREEARYTVYGRRVKGGEFIADPLFASDDRAELMKWLNDPWTESR